jgi:hypothetical protein
LNHPNNGRLQLQPLTLKAAKASNVSIQIFFMTIPSSYKLPVFGRPCESRFHGALVAAKQL